MSDCSITPIFKCPTLESEELMTKKRLEIEQYFISLLKTYQPFGLNISKRKYPESQQSNLLSRIQAQQQRHQKLLETTFRICKKSYQMCSLKP